MNTLKKIIGIGILKEASGYTMKNVGSGYGKLGGGVAAGIVSPAAQIPGMIAGHFISKKVVKNPNKKINEKSKLHRIGAIADESTRAKRILKYAAIGAGLGLGAGTGLGSYIKHNTTAESVDLKDEVSKLRYQRIDEFGGGIEGFSPAKIAMGGTALGAALGFGAAAMRGGYVAGKKLGYGKLGRIGTALTPLAGLTTPGGKKKKKESK